MASGLTTIATALDPQAMLTRFGTWAVLVVVFAETALPAVGICPVTPCCWLDWRARSVLGAARLSLPLVLACAGVGALAGAQTGFWLGRRGGRVMRLRRSAGRSSRAPGRGAVHT
ncbi:hypothetical protein SALBM311S_03788 [Streptomyces alboniger]